MGLAKKWFSQFLDSEYEGKKPDLDSEGIVVPDSKLSNSGSETISIGTDACNSEIQAGFDRSNPLYQHWRNL